MTTVSFASAHPDVAMFSCSGFAQALNFANLAALLFVLSTFIFVEKRLAFPSVFFFFLHNVYLLAFPNFVRDECLQNVLLSFGQTFFHRIGLFLSTAAPPASPRNFVYQIGHFESIVSNLFGVNLVAVLCLFFCVFFVLLCFAIVFSCYSRRALAFFRRIAQAFVFRAPLRTLDAVFMPVSLFSLLVFADLGAASVGDIVLAGFYSVLLLAVLWASVFLLNSYLRFYIDFDFLRRFGGLYDYLHFFTAAQANQVFNGQPLKFSSFKSLNLIRNHSTRLKISAFAKSLVVAMTVNFSSQVLPLALLLVLLVLEFAIFVVLKKNERLYYYSSKADAVAIAAFVGLLFCYVFMIINAVTASVSQVAAVAVMLVVFLVYLLVLGFGFYELAASQEKDLLWKIKQERIDLTGKKERFISEMKNFDDGAAAGLDDNFKRKFNLGRVQRLNKRKHLEANAAPGFPARKQKAN